MATKKRTWEQNEQKVAWKATKPTKACVKDCKCKDKVEVSREALVDWRITINELTKELEDARIVLDMRKTEINNLNAKISEQDNIINDTFDSMIELSDKIDWYRLGRNISIAVNVILIVWLILCS